MPAARYTVVINDRMLRSAKTGVGHYTAQLLRWLPEVRPEASIVPFHATHISRCQVQDLLATRDNPEAAGGEPFRWPWAVRRVLQIGYGGAFRSIARRRGYELYHEPNHVPIRCSLPTVTTIHDLSVIRHPEWHPADRIAWYNAYFQRGIEQTEHFITVSGFTRDECVGTLGLDPNRISVIHLAPREVFVRGPESRDVSQSLKDEFGLAERFLIFVGTIEPRKNLMGLLEAYAGLDSGIRRNLGLVVVGMHGWETESVKERTRALGIADGVRLLGYVSDERLAALYRMARVFAMPSRYEGFGLPPLEAMACGCPCIVSNAASLPEVVGDAAVMVNPEDTDALSRAIAEVAEDEVLRSDLIERGLARAAEFSWQRFAEQHDAVYRSVLGR